MAKVLRCSDLIPGCPAVIDGQHVADVMVKVAQHAKEAHGLAPIPAKVAAKIKAAIRDR
jgi:predicted small metal-binding protein